MFLIFSFISELVYSSSLYFISSKFSKYFLNFNPKSSLFLSFLYSLLFLFFSLFYFCNITFLIFSFPSCFFISFTLFLLISWYLFSFVFYYLFFSSTSHTIITELFFIIFPFFQPRFFVFLLIVPFYIL